jgi:hydrogenase maturation factor
MAVLDAGGVSALHDPTEGGLATGVRELALAADCGATVEREAVPVLPETEAIAGALGLDPLGMLASGSLLIAAAPDSADRLISAGHGIGVRLTRIGEVTPWAGRSCFTAGVELELPLHETDEIGRAMTRRRPSSSGTRHFVAKPVTRLGEWKWPQPGSTTVV